MESENVLKPCPFCGSEAYLSETWDNVTKYVQCTSCGCKTGTSKNSLEVIERWNRRAQPEKPRRKKSTSTAS